MAAVTKKRTRKVADDGFVSIGITPLMLKNFTFSDIIEYCEVLDEAHKTRNNYRHEMKKGQQLLKERFITGIRHKEDVNGYEIKAKHKAEMKKRECYEVTCWISNDNKVICVCMNLHELMF